MKKTLLMCILGLISVTNAYAVPKLHLQGKYPVCTSEKAFERLQAILQHNDLESFKKIMRTECIMPDEKIEIDKVVSRGWTSGVAHVKIYIEGNLYDVWTNTENVGS